MTKEFVAMLALCSLCWTPPAHTPKRTHVA
jgi:hypothetical protein